MQGAVSGTIASDPENEFGGQSGESRVTHGHWDDLVESGTIRDNRVGCLCSTVVVVRLISMASESENEGMVRWCVGCVFGYQALLLHTYCLDYYHSYLHSFVI